MVGFSSTSNVAAARLYGLPATGTMAHSYVEAFTSELDAFRAFAADYPGDATFLVDTYDTLGGLAHAIEVIGELGAERNSAIRLDSGDLGLLAGQARRQLDDAGLSKVRIVVSGDLDEYRLAALVEGRVPVDGAGVGTRLGVIADAPYLESVYKLVAYGDRPVAKLSDDKATLPGAKQVFRRPGCANTVGLRTEQTPPDAESLLEPVMTAGRRLGPPLSPAEVLLDAKRRFEADLAQLPESARRLEDGEAHEPPRSAPLQELANEVWSAIRNRSRSRDST